MALLEKYDLDNIRNEAEELVFERVEDILPTRSDVCRCSACVLDLVAFTLNRVTLHYSVSLLRDLHPDQRKKKKSQVEVDLALRAGMQRLRDHPHHEPGYAGPERENANG